MFKLATATATVLALTSTAVMAMPTQDDLAKAFEMMGPTHTVIEDDVLYVVLPQQRITDTIYQTTISFGACIAMAFGELDLSGIDEIHVANQFGAQGYVYEGGEEGCERLNEMPASDSMVGLMGMSRTFSRTSDPLPFVR